MLVIVCCMNKRHVKCSAVFLYCMYYFTFMYFLLKKVKIIFFIYFFNTIIKYNLRVILYFIIIM